MRSKIVCESGLLHVYEPFIRPFGFNVISTEINYEGNDVGVSYSDSSLIDVNLLKMALKKSPHKVYEIGTIRKDGLDGVSFIYVIKDVKDERYKYETMLR